MISTRTHGVIDYVVGILLIAAPYVLGFDNGGPAHRVPMVLGASAILYSLLTRYELGLVKFIPMPVHLGLDAFSGILLLVSPWLLRFADLIWWPHVVVGIAEILVVLMTKRVPRRSPRDEASRRV